MTEDFKRKLTAILSADVVGYSRLMGDDETATVKTLETYKGIMSSLIKQHRGRVVDSPGDNLLAEFGSVVDAVQCAVSIQKELQTRNSDLPEHRRMEFRIGINLGDVIEEEDRIYGDGVNIAARLEALADPGGICVSKTAFDQIESKLPLGYEFLGEQTVKNITKPVGAYKVLMETRVVDSKTKREAKDTSFWRRKSILSLGIIIILALAIVLYWNFYSRGPDIKPASIESEQETAVSKVKEARKTIAVLPFENLSSDKDQEYFSDGLADALITKLSQVKDLQVTARTSSFYFKGKNVDMRTIGETLEVSYLLEGSVQKSENQLRVIAQLIKAADGYHLWSETYDCELKDIFTIQDEIIKEVTTALSIALGVGEFSRPGMTRNIEAYDMYLRASANFSKMDMDSSLRAIDETKQALDIDPEFGLAWILLRKCYLYHAAALPPQQLDDYLARMREAYKNAQEAAPDMVELHIIAAEYQQRIGNWIKADSTYKQILDKHGHANAEANACYGNMLFAAGRTSDALLYLQRAKRLNPLDAELCSGLVSALQKLNRRDEAFAEARRCLKLEDSQISGFELIDALSENDRQRAVTIIKSQSKKAGFVNAIEAADLLLIEDTETALSDLKKICKNPELPWAERLILIHIAMVLGDVELAFENFKKLGTLTYTEFFWVPDYKALRQLPAFKTLVRDNGLYDYWRESDEWPDLCRPISDDDFECE